MRLLGVCVTTPLRHGELSRRHLPPLGRRLQQHAACRCAALAHVLVRRADAAAAAGRHVAPDAVAREVLAGRRVFGRDLVPVALQLFDDELREAGQRTLPHLRARDAHNDRVVRLDEHPGIDLGARVRRGRCFLRGSVIDAEWNVEAERKPAACGGRTDEEAAPAQTQWFSACRPPQVFLPSIEALLLPAAKWMAARMRWWVPQRQMLSMASSISASVGLGLFFSSATAVRIWPDWQ